MTNNVTSEQLIKLDDIQGLIVRGYNMNVVRYFVLRVTESTEAKKFISDLANGRTLKITTAGTWTDKPSYCLNIGFTFEGLKALKLSSKCDPDQAFNHRNYTAFKEGAIFRSEAIGDIKESAASEWVDSLKVADKVHILLFLFAENEQTLIEKSEQLQLTDKLTPRGIEILGHFNGAKLLGKDGKPSDTIHFGYRDGIAQPRVKGFPTKYGIEDNDQPEIPAYQFILLPGGSYKLPNPAVLLNGSFAAFRVLEQNVAGFEMFLQLQQEVNGIDPEILTAKMCGRWRNGVPLDISPQSPYAPELLVSDAKLNSFDYSLDPEGVKCPWGSHIRRTNPRHSAEVPGTPNGRRLIRRGIPYGTAYNHQTANEARGLLGLFICASLEGQFEFVMKEWVNKGEFTSLGNEKDPLLGDNYPKNSTFTIPTSETESVKINGFERFITTKGGAYCFFPSITALKYMFDL